MYLDAKNLYGWAMCQKLPVNGFQWIKNLSKFDESFIKSYDENSNKGYFLEADVEFLKNYLIFIKIFHFYQKEKKLENVKSLFATYEKEKYVVHIRALQQH